jgi:acetyl esterase
MPGGGGHLATVSATSPGCRAPQQARPVPPARNLIRRLRNIDLAGQVVLYGPLVHMDYVGSAGVREWSERDQRFGPTFASTSWYWAHYVGAGERGADPRASVLLDTNMASAPPALITAGTLDTFCEECVAYGHKLSDSGVKVQISEYPRLTHGYTAHGWMPSSNRSQLACGACMETLANVRVLAYS